MKTFDFMRNHPNMPSDKVPYWDGIWMRRIYRTNRVMPRLPRV
jgi:hypothetical protein